MADNVAITPGAGATIAADDVGGVLHQRVKLDLGGDGVSEPVSGALPVHLAAGDFWRVDLTGRDLSDIITPDLVVMKDSIASADQSNPGQINVGLGTTGGAELLLRSARSFTGPMSARLSASLSQRIANQTMDIVLADVLGFDLSFTLTSTTTMNVTKVGHGLTAVDIDRDVSVGGFAGITASPYQGARISAIVDADTFTLTTIGTWPASGSGTVTVYGLNCVGLRLTGTSATSVSTVVRDRGRSNPSNFTTIASQSFMQISHDGITASMADSPSSMVAAPTWTPRYATADRVPDPSLTYYLFIHCYNHATNPASNTTGYLGRITVDAVGNPKAVDMNAPTVSIAGTVPVSVAATLPVSLSGNQAINVVQLGGQTADVFTPANTGRSLGVMPNAPASNADVTSSARTTSGNSGTIADNYGAAVAALVNVTAASGTTPTLDVSLEESYDNGTTWQTVWAFPRLTAVSKARMPFLPVGGRRRWAWVIAGTTPSFTFTITAMRGAGQAALQRQFFDRTAGVLAGTLNATTAVVDVAGCDRIRASVTLGAATSPATYRLQLSDDGVNFFDVGTATAGVASATIMLDAGGIIASFARVAVTVAGSGQTGTHVAIVGNS